MSYDTYILKSLTDGIRYVGSGEDDQTRAEAVRGERFLKSGQGRKWLDENFKK